MRRWRIPGDNIVSLLHGIALLSCHISAEFKVQQLPNKSCSHVILPPFCSEKAQGEK